MTDAAAQKAQLRKTCLAARGALNTPERAAAAAEHLYQALLPHQGKVISGYAAMRSEVDPMPALARLDAQICLPVVVGKAQPLAFREWRPGTEMVEGAFGAMIPAHGAELEPQVLVVPLAAFDGRGLRLGYGGGFYDRTLEKLRAAGPVLAVGFAFAGQRVAALPPDPHDQPLDLIVTEDGLHRF
ncbi:5-formyltetrahydrofolate cyclo-ligase [Actibacterium sp. XHP0104]|uniref:5-formyltetrahydrofolate cyclo-ligase n=1 Tax=Actibacterium sp. XHP0104 TaxID=2984335 RepID=UPI0021E87F5A|nr:5-formyltetrahydrofolate cyclo-ligase [Actibacterium sp. XHP0104]MCV2880605.1 5-formyltetrahydrofolate cyclo-ligase [Actibacterium sp. XHP0104]